MWPRSEESWLRSWPDLTEYEAKEWRRQSCGQGLAGVYPARSRSA